MQKFVVKVIVVNGHMVCTAFCMYVVTAATHYVIVHAAATAVATDGAAGAGAGQNGGSRVGGTRVNAENDGTDHVHDHVTA